MLKLIRKELILNKKLLIINFLIITLYFIWASTQVDSYRAYLVMVCLLVSLAIPMSCIAREEKFKTGILTCSLPFRRSTIVASKYATSWILMAVGWVYAVLVSAVNPFSAFDAGSIFTLKYMLLSLFFLSIFFVFFLPFVIRFGVTGIIIFLVLSQLLALLAMVIISIMGKKGNIFNSVLQGMEQAIRYILNHEGTVVFYLIVLASVFLLNFLSIKAAQVLYSRKEL